MATLVEVEKKRVERAEARAAAEAAAEEEAAPAAEEAAPEEGVPGEADELEGLDPNDELALALAEEEEEEEDGELDFGGKMSQLLIIVNSVDGLHKLAEPPKDERKFMPEGPWNATTPVEGAEPSTKPPRPRVTHSLFVEGKITLEHEVSEYSFISHEIPLEEAKSHIKLKMRLSVDDFVPSVRARDALHSSGVEFHIVRRTSFDFDKEYYAALPVPEVPEEATDEEKEALREKAEAMRTPPESSHVDSLLRVGSSVLSSLVQGEDKLVLQTEMWEGEVVDKAMLTDWSIVFSNKKKMHSPEFERAMQSLRLQVFLNDPDEAMVEVVEVAEEVVEDTKGKKGKK